MDNRKNFGPVSFGLRWLFALLLVGLIFNPTGYSYYHWLAESGSEMLPLKFIGGVVLLIGAIIYRRDTVGKRRTARVKALTSEKPVTKATAAIGVRRRSR